MLQKYRVMRRAELFREAGIVFIHVPRTAGSSIADALYGRSVGHFTARDLVVAPKDVQALARFGIVRNPWDRLVSAWSLAKQGVSRDGKVIVRNACQYAVPEFATFDSFVRNWLAPRDLHSLDGIFRPQIDYLAGRQGAVVLDHLGRFEDLAETYRWLEAQAGLNLSLRTIAASERSAYAGYYTDTTREIAARLYADDIAAFGYRF